MSLPPFTYPVLGIGREVRKDYRGEDLRTFRDEWAITTIDSTSLENGFLIGMLLIDDAGRNWVIQSVKKLHASGSLLGKVVRFLFGQQEFKIELDLVEKEPVSFDEIKARVCKSIDDHPDDWRDDEAVAGEDGPPRDELEMLEELKAHVRRSRTIAEMLEKVIAGY